MQRNLQHWQELESSSERQKANERGTISNALRVRDKLSGREYACSISPKISKLCQQLTDANCFAWCVQPAEWKTTRYPEK